MTGLQQATVETWQRKSKTAQTIYRMEPGPCALCGTNVNIGQAYYQLQRKQGRAYVGSGKCHVQCWRKYRRGVE